MAVYVDDVNIRAEVPDGARVARGRWSHLFADTETELRAFAHRIGLRPGWIQHPGQPHVHFDVTARMRQRALAAGAVPVTWCQAGEFFAHRARHAAAAGRGQALRQAAHLYLGHGLHPVPGWGATPAPPPITGAFAVSAPDVAHVEALLKYGIPPDVPATVSASVPLDVTGEPATPIKPPVKVWPTLVTLPAPLPPCAVQVFAAVHP